MGPSGWAVGKKSKMVASDIRQLGMAFDLFRSLSHLQELELCTCIVIVEGNIVKVSLEMHCRGTNLTSCGTILSGNADLLEDSIGDSRCGYESNK